MPPALPLTCFGVEASSSWNSVLGRLTTEKGFVEEQVAHSKPQCDSFGYNEANTYSLFLKFHAAARNKQGCAPIDKRAKMN